MTKLNGLVNSTRPGNGITQDGDLSKFWAVLESAVQRWPGITAVSEADKFAVGYVSPTGIGGWLALFIVWLWFYAVLDSVAVVPAVFRQLSYSIIAESLAFSGLTGSAAYLLTIKNSNGVLLAKVFLAVRVVVALVDFARVGKADALRTCGIFVINIGFYLYLVKSNRVKAVYSPAT